MADEQRPLDAVSRDLPLIPVRMVNEFVYCPRLAYLEWVQGEWADSVDTVVGRTVHRRVDRPGGRLPPVDQMGAEQAIHARSVLLESEHLGIVAKLDLVEGDDGKVIPIDYKKGKRPHAAAGAYDPERVQVCAQGLLLREHGYRCDEGVIYFAGSKERVHIALDEGLVELTRAAIQGLRALAESASIPAPLVDSPKCPRCALVSICLPDEVNFVSRHGGAIRPLAVAATEAFPLHVQSNRARISKSGETLRIEVDEKPTVVARLPEVSQLVLQGNVQISTATLHELMRREIPVVWMSFGGWYLGHTQGTGHRNIELRMSQFARANDPETSLLLARGWVEAKLRNQRVFLRRNGREGDPAPVDDAVQQLEAAERNARRADSIESLLGFEGAGAAAYFGAFAAMLKAGSESQSAFAFEARNRRPPRDPVNALLSFAYALLVRQWVVTLASVGFDPYCGFYHRPRHGRPALALDMMEPFRPLVADSAVITAINTGVVRPDDFVRSGPAVALNENGRRRFIGALERRLAEEITHPIFGYRVSYRRVFEIQARLLGRFLLGEIDRNPNFTTR